MYVYVNSNPINFIDMLGLLILWDYTPYNSNWGGPGWAGGQEVKDGWNNPKSENYKEGLESVEARDPIDQCYKEHDLCYEKCRVDYTCSKRRDCFSKCDREAVDQLIRAITSDNRFISYSLGGLAIPILGIQGVVRDSNTTIADGATSVWYAIGNGATATWNAIKL